MAEAEFLQIIRRILDWSFTEEDKLRIVSVIKEAVFEFAFFLRKLLSRKGRGPFRVDFFRLLLEGSGERESV